MLDAKAIEAIADLARKSVLHEVREVPGLPDKVCVFSREGMEVIDRRPEARKHRVDTLASLVAAAKTWSAKPVVFHSLNSIAAVLDDEGLRRNLIDLDLTITEQFGLLRDLGAGRLSPFTPPDLVDLLRMKLPGAVDPTLFGKLRRVEFRAGSTTVSEKTRTAESMGRSLEAAVNGLDELPETTLVEVPVYDLVDLSTVVRVECLLVPDPRKQVIHFRPKPDSLPAAIAEAQQRIAARLKQDLPEATVLAGRP